MHSGKVSGIQDDYNGSGHVRITVKHGKRKRSKGPKGEKGELMDHSRPESTLIVPKEHASKFTHNQSVKVGIMPDDDEGAEDESAEMAPAIAKKKAPPFTKKSGNSGKPSKFRKALGVK